MLLPLFGILLAISFALVFLGYYSKEGAYSLVGFFFIFLLGAFTLLPGTLQYQAGENVTISSDNSTGPTTITEVHAPTYVSFNDSSTHKFGVWLAALGVVGVAIGLNELRRKKK